MKLYPYAGAHAVQSVAFALEWAQELTEKELLEVAATHESIKKSLPNSQPIQTLTLQVGPSNLLNSIPVPVVTGHQFTRQGHSGVSRSLEVSKTRLVGQVNDYTRWEPVWAEVQTWFSAVTPKISDRSIKTIVLEYTDVFQWRGTPEEFNSSEVFRDDSDLIPKNVFKLNDLWHNHHGYFELIDEPIKSKLLENVNIAILEDLGQKSVVITTLHKANLIDDLVGWEIQEPKINEMMQNLHHRNKILLKSILNDNVLKSIGLSE